MIFRLFRIKPVFSAGFIFGGYFRFRFAFSDPASKYFARTEPPSDRFIRGEERAGSGRALAAKRRQGEVFSVANRSKGTAKNLDTQPARIEGERLKPIRKVMREIERPDGTILRVEVPVFPPFKLKDRRKAKN